MLTYDPIIYSSKTTAMQRILDHLGRGYPLHTSGTLPVGKALGMAQKFASKYAVHLTKDQRRRARGRGEGVAVLVIHPHEFQNAFRWWLLVSDRGEHPAHIEEDLRRYDSKRRSDRLRWGEEFEVVRRPRPGRGEGLPILTWQYTHNRYEELREQARNAGRQQSARLAREVLKRLACMPGFSGVRFQSKQLIRELEYDWKRHHRPSQKAPQQPQLPYVSRRRDEVFHLSELVL